MSTIPYLPVGYWYYLLDAVALGEADNGGGASAVFMAR